MIRSVQDEALSHGVQLRLLSDVAKGLEWSSEGSAKIRVVWSDMLSMSFLPCSPRLCSTPKWKRP